MCITSSTKVNKAYFVKKMCKHKEKINVREKIIKEALSNNITKVENKLLRSHNQRRRFITLSGCKMF